MGDNIVMLWNLGWVKYALAHHDSGFWFPNAYYPQGFLFLFSTHTWLDGVLGFAASPLLPRGPEGIVLWANITQLFATIATGLFAMATLRQWGVKRPQLQLIGASAVTFCWFRTYAITGHYHFYGTEWMLAALWAAARSRRLLRAQFIRPAMRWSLLAGLLIGLTYLNDQTHAVFAAILCVCTLASLQFSRAKPARRHIFINLALLAGGSLVLSSIHLIPLLLAIASGKFNYKVAMLDVPRLVDLTSVFVPPNRHLMGLNAFARLREAHHLTCEEGPYLGAAGYLFLATGIIGSLVAIRQLSRSRITRLHRVLGATLLGAIFLVFTCGEFLTIGQHNFIMLPGRMLRHLPGINNIRILQRWIWPTQLCLALAGTLSITFWWAAHLTRLRNLLLLSLAVLFCAEGKWYPPADPVDIHSSFLDPPGLVKAIRENYKSGGVLLMPMEYAYGHANHLQLLVGYDIPMTAVYTARAPFDVTRTPWHGTQWTPESATWLQEHKVGMVVFPYFEGTTTSSANLKQYADWISHAKEAVPGLRVLNRSGESAL